MPFAIPAPELLPERLTGVLDAIYAADSAGGDGGTTREHAEGLVDEALRLARVLVERLPDEAEPPGLLALILHSHARTAARRRSDGSFVPLDHQDVSAWDAAAMREAEEHLAVALGLRRVGPHQIHAAIQSVHNGGR